MTAANAHTPGHCPTCKRSPSERVGITFHDPVFRHGEWSSHSIVRCSDQIHAEADQAPALLEALQRIVDHADDIGTARSVARTALSQAQKGTP